LAIFTHAKFTDLPVYISTKLIIKNCLFVEMGGGDVDPDIETHPYRPEDSNENNPFVKEILDNGIRIV